MNNRLDKQQEERTDNVNAHYQKFRNETIELMIEPLLPNTDYEVGNFNYHRNTELLASFASSPRGPRFCCNYCWDGIKSRITDFLNIYANQSGSCINTLQGLFPMFVLGTVIGVCLPNNHSDLSTPTYRYISSIMSYTHILCWCFSLYPQVIMNYQCKSVAGLSTDSQVMNFFNHLSFIVFNAFFVFHQPDSRSKEEFGFRTNGVKTKDLIYSSHVLLVTMVLLWQLFRHKGFVLNPVSKLTVVLLLALFCINTAFVVGILTHIHHCHWADFLNLLASTKVILSVCTAVPQIMHNIKRQSTEGWNVWNVILDFIGTILCVAQILGDCIDSREYAAMKHTWPKLSMCLCNLIFDLVFLIQHHIKYRKILMDDDLSVTSPIRPFGDFYDVQSVILV